MERKNMKKRFLSIAASFLLALSGIGLTACSGDTPTSSEEGSSTPSSSETSSEKELTPEEIVEEAVNLENVTIKTFQVIDSENEIAEGVNASSHMETNIELYVTASKMRMKMTIGDYSMSYPLSYVLTEMMHNPDATDEQIITLATTMGAMMKRNAEDELEVVVDRTAGKVSLNFTSSDTTGMDVYVYYDSDAKQMYSIQADDVDDGQYMTQGEYNLQMGNYTLTDYADLLVKIIKEGTFDATNKKYQLADSYEYRVRGTILDLEKPYVIVNDKNFPVEFGYTMDSEELGGRFTTKQTLSNINSTTVNVPAHQKVACDHSYLGVDYDPLDNNKCRAFCLGCHKYIEEAHEHHFEENSIYCTKCTHVKDGEAHYFDAISGKYSDGSGSKLAIYKRSDNKVYVNLSFFSIRPYDFDVNSNVQVRDGEDELLYTASICYNKEKKDLLYYAVYPSEQPETSCVKLEKLVLAYLTGVDINFVDEDNPTPELTAIAKLTPAQIKTTYNAKLELNQECTGYLINHHNGAPILEPLDDRRTGMQGVCEVCSLLNDYDVVYDHIDEMQIKGQPIGFDPQGHTYTYFSLGIDDIVYYVDPTTVSIDHAFHGFNAGVWHVSTSTKDANPTKVITEHVDEDKDHLCDICHATKLDADPTSSSPEITVYLNKASLDFEHDTTNVSLAYHEMFFMTAHSFSNNTYTFKYVSTYQTKYSLTATKSESKVTLSVVQNGREVATFSFDL